MYDKQTEVEDGSGEGEEDITESGNIHYDIQSYGADLTVDGLVRRFDRGDIYRPEFQRNFVWSRQQASRLIESVLLGLPIPSIFLYTEEPSKKQLIIDGLQRLTTLHAFTNNCWPNGKTAFKLTGKDNQYVGKSFETLDDTERRTFEDAVIHVTYIQQNRPKDDRSSTFHIFERLNSGGTPLQAQEMRAAIFGGAFQEHLEYVNENTDLWRKVFGNIHKRAKDQELILRFLALHFNGDNYKQPMKLFLNDFMNEHRNAKAEELGGYAQVFEKTMKRAHDALGDEAFRHGKSGGFSAPYFDSFMVAIASNNNVDDKTIKKAYDELLKNREFIDLARAATTNATSVRRRIEMVKEAFNAAT